MLKFKKILASTLVISSIIITGNSAIAKTPSDSSLVELAKVSDFDTVFQESMKSGFVQSMTQGIMTRPDIQALDLKKQAQAQKAIERFATKVISNVDTTDLSKKVYGDFITVSKKHFNQKEVDALLKFYNTPEGKSIIAKQNTVTNELMQSVLPAFTQNKAFMEQIDANVEKYGDEFEKELEAILK